MSSSPTATNATTGARLLGGITLLFFAFSPLVWSRLNPQNYEGGRSRNVGDQHERNTSSIAVMLGEFRTGLSDVLFLKTERYLHGGAAYAPHDEYDALSVESTQSDIDFHPSELDEDPEATGHNHDHGDHEDHAGTCEHDDHADHAGRDEHHFTRTMIPAPKQDYRGIIGALQREVKPWRDPSEDHFLTDGSQLLPWFKVMTVSDPHFVRGYTAGGYWLSKQSRKEAINFLKQGVLNNPKAFQIHLVLSQIYLKEAKSLGAEHSQSKAQEFYQLARGSALQAAEIAAERWTPSQQDGNATWGYYDQNDALACFYQAVLTEQQYGSPEKPSKLAQKYLSLVGTNAVLERLVKSSH